MIGTTVTAFEFSPEIKMKPDLKKSLFVIAILAIGFAKTAYAKQPTPPTTVSAKSDKREIVSTANTNDQVLDMAMARCKAVGLKLESEEFRKCALDQITLISNTPINNMGDRSSSRGNSGDSQSRTSEANEKKVNRVAPKLDIAKSPPTDNYYPPSLIKAEIVGVSTVRACVDATGKVTGEPSIANSSGTQGLDDAALMWSRVALFSPGTADGVPTVMCTMFNVRFGLNSDPPPTENAAQFEASSKPNDSLKNYEAESSRRNEIVRVSPTLDVRKSPSTANFYPQSARQAGLKGDVSLRVCVDPSGKVDGTPTVLKSSGHPSLDAAAIMWSRGAVFTPGTVDGVPFNLCTGIFVRFNAQGTN